MKYSELSHILAAIIILTVVIGFSSALDSNWQAVGISLVFSIIIIAVNVLSKKFMANSLDSDVEHRIWSLSRYGLKKHQKFKKPWPLGIILPLIVTLFTIGTFKLMTLLTYETRALKRRAARRFGIYSFKEMTDWHNAIIGATGIISLLVLSIVLYLLPFSGLEYLAKLAIYYSFFNMLPISNLDGTQIYFGSRILYSVLAIITIIFTVLALTI